MSVESRWARLCVAGMALGVCLAGCERDPAEKGRSDAAARMDKGGWTAPPQDSGSDSVWSSRFPAVLDGIWLVGWSGGTSLHFYSWIRFSGASAGGGTAEFLDGHDLTSNTPYWPCSGKGQWHVTGAQDTVWLEFPADCTGVTSAAYTFQGFQPPAYFPKGSVLHADVRDVPPVSQLDGHKYVASQCDAKMSVCADPLK